jgi:hypothetical protein
MSPEYVMEGIVSVKSDVYSFGVLLLEIVSVLKVDTTGLTQRSHNLIDYVSVQSALVRLIRDAILTTTRFIWCRRGAYGRMGAC